MLRTCLLALGALLFVSAGEALAQQRDDGQSDLNLPAWAEPNQGAQPQQAPPQATQQAPPPPSAPEQVPLGGLEWLALAGGSYALHRLRRQKDAEGSSDVLP